MAATGSAAAYVHIGGCSHHHFSGVESAGISWKTPDVPPVFIAGMIIINDTCRFGVFRVFWVAPSVGYGGLGSS